MKKFLVIILFSLPVFSFAQTSLCDNGLQNNFGYGATDKDTNGEVSKLQDFLNLTKTGGFGNLTAFKLYVFQREQKILSNSVEFNPRRIYLGPKTRQAIKNVTCGRGAALNQNVQTNVNNNQKIEVISNVNNTNQNNSSINTNNVNQTQTSNVNNINQNSTVQQVSTAPVDTLLTNSTSGSFGSSNMGWDYNLTKKCFKTIGKPGDQNYFEINDQCGQDGKHWLLVVESENAPGQSMPGPGNRSFLINATNSPVSMNVIPHASSLGTNWSVNLKVDHRTTPHPNGKGYFTYFGMMDHVDEKGGPLPAPKDLKVTHTISYSDWTPAADDASRMLVGAQFYYKGKAHMLEINLASSQWGDADPDPEAILVNHDFMGNGSSEFVVLDGSKFNLDIKKGVGTSVTIPWGTILQHVIQKGWFEQIGTAPNVTQAVYIGTEVKNQGVGNLWQTDFRVSK